jgi:hypothetical protein
MVTFISATQSSPPAEVISIGKPGMAVFLVELSVVDRIRPPRDQDGTGKQINRGVLPGPKARIALWLLIHLLPLIDLVGV